MEEVLEMITWQQLGFHTKPVGMLNVNGFFDSLLAFFDSCVNEVRAYARPYFVKQRAVTLPVRPARSLARFCTRVA